MKTLLAVIVALFVFAMPVRAANISVANVSNQAEPCGPHSLVFLLGHCEHYGPGTLQITIVTAPGEFPLACQQGGCSPGYDTYLLILYQGTWYTLAWQDGRMVPVVGDINTMPPTYPWGPSFYAIVTGQIPYSNTFDIQSYWGAEGSVLQALPLDGMEMFIGISPIGRHSFGTSTFQQIWPQRITAKPTTNG
jgi:hypothetical protein